MSEHHFNRNQPQQDETLNPWKSMWLHPRRTIRYLLATNPRYAVLVLAIAGGIVGTFNLASDKEVADSYQWPGLLGITLLIGTVLGVVGLYFAALVLRWSGSWIGGRASGEQLRTVVAWAGLPSLWMLAIWIAIILIFGAETFSKEMPSLETNLLLPLLMLVFALSFIVLQVWGIVLLVAGISEVQGFSILRTLANLLLAVFLVFAISSLAGIVMALLIPLFSAPAG